MQKMFFVTVMFSFLFFSCNQGGSLFKSEPKYVSPWYTDSFRDIQKPQYQIDAEAEGVKRYTKAEWKRLIDLSRQSEYLTEIIPQVERGNLKFSPKRLDFNTGVFGALDVTPTSGIDLGDENLPGYIGYLYLPESDEWSKYRRSGYDAWTSMGVRITSDSLMKTQPSIRRSYGAVCAYAHLLKPSSEKMGTVQ